MKMSSGLAKGAALSLALMAHGAFALVVVMSEDVQIEGANGASDVRLGNAFQDMVAGTLSPEPAEKISPEHSPENSPLSAEKAAESTPSEPVPLLTAISSDHAPSVKPEAVSVQKPTALPAQTTQNKLASVAPNSPPITSSPRPKLRSASLVAAHKATPPAKPNPKPATQPTPRAKPATGNAAKNARAGEATGKTNEVARQSGAAGRQKTAGNAAASNYPGLVMRKLARAGKPRINARGTAVVAFKINTNGHLAATSISQSSGSSALDQAAVRLVKGAAPFPKPPQGARRSFSIEVKGR